MVHRVIKLRVCHSNQQAAGKIFSFNSANFFNSIKRVDSFLEKYVEYCICLNFGFALTSRKSSFRKNAKSVCGSQWVYI